MTPFRIGDTLFGQGPIPDLMGIVNCTPDSFFDGGRHATADLAFEHAMLLVDEGAVLIDVGGESTRPGADAVSAQEELARVLPVIERLAQAQSRHRFAISVDTMKASVALAAVKAGAQVVNDVSMLRHDPAMASVVAQTGASAVLNHMRGEPRTMQANPSFLDVVGEVSAELMAAALTLQDLGVDPTRICLDPGIGFGKRLEDNVRLIAQATRFVELGYPVLYGLSRKSFIGRTPGLEQSDRLVPSVVAAVIAAQGGVRLLRVHDVKATREALLMWAALFSL